MRRALISALRQAAASPLLKEQAYAFSTRAAQEPARSHAVTAVLAALGAGTAVSYGFSVQQPAHAEAQNNQGLNSPNNNTTTSDPLAAIDQTVESRYKLPTDCHPLPKEIVLYQYEVCPFCNKVKAFLDFYNLPYRVVEVNPLSKAELKWSEYKKVPVVVLDGKDQYNDSSVIISRLAADLQCQEPQQAATRGSWFTSKSKAAKNGSNTSSRAEEEKWRQWVDDWFVRVITVNIYRTAKESFQTFDYIADHGNFSWAEREAARVFGATLMWGISGRLRRKYGVDGDVREVLFDSANEWAAAVGNRPFLGGSSPNLADLAVFGVLRSVTGTDTFHDVMHGTKIAPWYERMMKAVGDSAQLPSL